MAKDTNAQALNKKRNSKLTKEERVKIARKAAKFRWSLRDAKKLLTLAPKCPYIEEKVKK